MDWFERYRVGICLLVFIFFLVGLTTWLTAAAYKPDLPVPTAAGKFNYDLTEKTFPLTRYQNLLGGSLFFGNSESLIRFHSDLVLWGLIKGKPSRALVTAGEEEKGDTRIVKIGDRVNDEKIIVIGDKSITVRNQTGEGQVFLRE